MWELLSKIILWVAVSACGGVVLLIFIYLASGIQARAWLGIFEKYFGDKFNKLKKEDDERKEKQFPG